MDTPLKKERLRRNLSCEAVARAVGVSQATISRIEARKIAPKAPLANRIAIFFGNAVTRDQILFPEDYLEAPLPRRRRA